MKILRCQLAILGDSGCGKTALTQMFKSEGVQYPKNYVMTTGAEFHTKTVKIPEKDTSVEFYVIDLSGKKIYEPLRKQLLSGCSMFALMYDISNEASFKSLEYWIKEFKDRVSNDVGGVLIGNKSDLSEERREVTVKKAKDWARDLPFFETSALRGTEVEAPFNELAHMFCNAYEDKMKLYSNLNRG